MAAKKLADLTIRLSPADRGAIEAAAKADHLPASTWLRQAALEKAAARKKERARQAQAEAMLERLRRLPRFERED